MNVNENGELTVILEGRLDALTAQTLSDELEEKLEGVTAVTIDAEKLEYISSAGLRTFLFAQQYMEENDKEDVRLINANESLMEILEETGFTKILNVVE